ncbi:MAG: hypothetical protein NTW65_13260 [Deltaproteobacteria bacterium]|nr:hypothetical protein [Deltaproteobacteria bacterium]
MINKKFLLLFALVLLISLVSCVNQLGKTVISKPDEYTHVYEAKETIILKAIAGVFREKNIGANVIIDQKNHWVDSDYVVSGDWRTKANARVKRLNWKECEVILAVTTEKKTETGWERRRLLEKEQYYSFFRVIDLKIYEEMSKIE